ncbi:hypothetical protein RV02_GL000422 [Enterococcus gilvus]|nr:hypothetical protein RV02_GL000422 [Enterococcus gilvus]
MEHRSTSFFQSKKASHENRQLNLFNKETFNGVQLQTDVLE